jgi:hypothetical protein
VTTRIISLTDPDDESDPLPPPTPLPVVGAPAAGVAPTRIGGVLVFAEGEWIIVTTRTVVGREPWNDPDVVAGTVVGMVIPGADGAVSRVHAELEPTMHGLTVLDRGSLNGTLVLDPGATAWLAVEAGVPRAVAHGAALSFGGRSCRLERLDPTMPGA